MIHILKMIGICFLLNATATALADDDANTILTRYSESVVSDSSQIHDGVDSVYLFKLFETIQQNIQNGNIKSNSHAFAPKIELHLRGGESGYFSANQAYYILENYFASRKLTNVAFSVRRNAESGPYATGSATLFIRGKRETVQVFVALIKVRDAYLISQFSIY